MQKQRTSQRVITYLVLIKTLVKKYVSQRKILKKEFTQIFMAKFSINRPRNKKHYAKFTIN